MVNDVKSLHLILSSARESAKMIKPAKTSIASTKPLLSVSQIANVTSFEEKIVSNSVRFIAKLSHIDLKLPCNSLILARLRLISWQDVLRSPCTDTNERKLPIIY